VSDWGQDEVLKLEDKEDLQGDKENNSGMYGRSDKRRGCLAEAGKQQGCVRSDRTAGLLPTACFPLLDIDTKFSCFLQADQTGSKEQYEPEGERQHRAGSHETH
jgi:hypothetical protein